MRVALDLDGVLANLVHGLLRAHGCDPDLWSQVATWEMVDECGLPSDQTTLWAPAADPQFWANLEPLPWMGDLLRALEARPIVVTAPLSRHFGASCEGKRAWVKKHLVDTRLVLTDHKWLLAGAGDLLVDDSPDQYRMWRLHGGCAVLWPANWNAARGRDPRVAISSVATLQNS